MWESSRYRVVEIGIVTEDDMTADVKEEALGSLVRRSETSRDRVGVEDKELLVELFKTCSSTETGLRRTHQLMKDPYQKSEIESEKTRKTWARLQKRLTGPAPRTRVSICSSVGTATGILNTATEVGCGKWVFV